jgi:hypothetical protein
MSSNWDKHKECLSYVGRCDQLRDALCNADRESMINEGMRLEARCRRLETALKKIARASTYASEPAMALQEIAALALIPEPIDDEDDDEEHP